METPRESLITQFTPPLCRANKFRRSSEVSRIISSLGMEQLLMLLEIFVRRESEFSNRAVWEKTVERPIMAVDVLIAGLGILEAFMKVEACWTGTLEMPFAVENNELLRLAGKTRQQFNRAAIPHDDFAQGFNADLLACFWTLGVLLVDVVPHLKQLIPERIDLEFLAVVSGLRDHYGEHDFRLVASREFCQRCVELFECGCGLRVSGEVSDRCVDYSADVLVPLCRGVVLEREEALRSIEL